MTSTTITAHSGSISPRRRWLALAAALTLPLLWAGCSPAPNQSTPAPAPSAKATDSKGTGPVVAKVNGAEIRQSDLAIAEEDVGQNMPPMAPEAKRDYLVTYVADMLLIAKAAEAKKIDDNDDFKQQMAFIRNKLLMETMMQMEGKAALSDAALHKVYDEATKQMGEEQEVRARHILVETEDEATAIAAELKNGADFATLAKEKSKDPGAAAEGGDLGYFTKDQMVPEFSDVAFKMQPGQVSAPVKSQFGWHIIKVEDKRIRPVPEFDKVRSQLESYVMRKAQVDYVGKLRADAKIERMDAKPDAKPAEPAKPDAKPAEPEKK
jgi:peptidyl-prolyl cis-trans isomerase C